MNTATKVYWAMKFEERPCIGEDCDLGAPCKRHERTAQVVHRLERLKKARVKK